MTSAEANMEIGYLTDELRAAQAEVRSLRGVVQAVRDLAYDADQIGNPYGFGRVLSGDLRAALAAAADAPQPEQACEATVSVDQISDDYEGLVPHPFPCRLDAGHEPDDPHEALVTWFTGEDE